MAEQLWEITQLACTAIITIGGAGAIIIGIIKWAKKPDDTRDETLKKHTELLDSDNKRLKNIEERQAKTEEQNRILMSSILALMSHAIDGNHTADLEAARNDLQEYLIKR